MELPPDLVDAFKEGRAAVFVGAGASIAAELPTWQELVATLAKELGVDPDIGTARFSPSALATLPQYYENRFGRRGLVRKLKELIRHPIEQSAIHDLIAQLPCDLYYTTNFDELLEEALRRQRVPYNVIIDDETARSYTERREPQVRKIHGTISQPHTLIISRSDYARFIMERPFIADTLRNDLSSYVFLFIGYSLSDPDFSNIYDHVVFTMGRMHQTHFICTPSPSDLEAEDLKARGIQAIDLTKWRGGNLSEKLTDFLLNLVEATTESIHVRRFFSGLERGQHIPLIITSRLHENENYVYYPACDVSVAQQVSRALAVMGCDAQMITDRVALENFDYYIKQDLILICSPNGNVFTRRVFELAGKSECNIQQRFSDNGLDRLLTDMTSGRAFRAQDPVHADGRTTRSEYSLIARYRNPWSLGRHIFVFAGVFAMGTHAAGSFISDLMNYRHLPWQKDDAVAVLELEYVSHDPYNYEYDVKSITSL